MYKLFLSFFVLISFFAEAQQIDSLNTAKNCTYMKPEEREMIYEINRVRSNPRSYLQYIEPMLAEAKQKLKKYGKGNRHYSLTYTTETINGKEKKSIDTTWHYRNEEDVKALSTLVADLKKLKPLSVLLPDSGIYNAARKHAKDQSEHNWQLMHTGSDGSAPWERITKFSPGMSSGNENIAGNSADGSARRIVIQLLVDDGIPGYGHRYNLLDPQWTHSACSWDHHKGYMHWWIQNFGVKKKK
jgi:uncharacterized protein YkwD